MADLGKIEYKVILYLLNCSVSGFSQIITSHRELAETFQSNEKEVADSLAKLFNLRMIAFKVKQNKSFDDSQSFVLRLNTQVEKWKINDVEEDSYGAIVYPFRRLGEHLQLVDSKVENSPQAATVKRIYTAFLSFQDEQESDQEKEKQAARLLCETYSIDQILLFVRYFKERIPSLSLLASSWQHYLDLYEEEHQSIDFSKLRDEHVKKDKQVKEAALRLLDSKEISLTSEEREVLTIIFQHRHPRRQLFWAYQSRSRYKNLMDFFAKNEEHMLSVTNSGSHVKKND